MQKLSIRLSRKDRKNLETITKKGTHPARVIRRAMILLQSHAGCIDAEIAKQTGASHRAVVDVRTRCALEGIDRALYDAPRSGKPASFTGTHEAQIVAIACTKAPEGRSRWTMQLLAKQAVKDGVVKKISSQSVWLMLNRQDCKPWLKKNVVYSDAHAPVQGTDGRHSDAVRQTLRSERAGRLSR
jgi:transposase